MLAKRLGEPASSPGVDEVLDLVAGFDTVLEHGFARVGPRQAEALDRFAAALAGTPLGEPVATAVEKVSAGSPAPEHLTALAGGRAALLGAVHDALLDGVDAILGRSRDDWSAGTGPQSPAVPDKPAVAGVPAAPENLLNGCRAWLHELAVTGWRAVDHDVVGAADHTIESVLAEPRLRRLAVLLDGLAAELRACCPVATVRRLPERRWADLWMRGSLLAHSAAWDGTAGATTVSGRLFILGVDVHEHGTAMQAQVHAILEPSDGTEHRLVRAAVNATKVDTIVGPALWRLLHGFPVLMGALAAQHVLDVTEMPLLPSGDLLWHDDRAAAGEPTDPFTTARVRLADALAPAVAPLERHPVRIAEPVLLEGYTVAEAGDTTVFEIDGAPLEVAVGRLPACGPLAPEVVARSTACLGLLRWDAGRWLVQPLAVRVGSKRAARTVHNGAWAQGVTDPAARKAGAKSTDAVDVLRERAGRLLRR